MGPIGDLVKKRRLALKLNQRDAGAMIGVSGPTVSRWETGTDVPTTEQVDALVAFLGSNEVEVLAAIHRQTSAANSDERIITMLGEVMSEMAALRRDVQRVLEPD